VCTSPFFAAFILGRRPKQLLYGDLGGTHLGSPCTNLHQPWTTAHEAAFHAHAAHIGSATHRVCVECIEFGENYLTSLTDSAVRAPYVLRPGQVRSFYAWEHHFPSALAVLLRSRLRAHTPPPTLLTLGPKFTKMVIIVHTRPPMEPDR
jgi:hypothetical protein